MKHWQIYLLLGGVIVLLLIVMPWLIEAWVNYLYWVFNLLDPRCKA